MNLACASTQRLALMDHPIESTSGNLISVAFVNFFEPIQCLILYFAFSACTNHKQIVVYHVLFQRIVFEELYLTKIAKDLRKLCRFL